MKKQSIKYILSSIGILLVVSTIVFAQRSGGARSSSFSSSSSRPSYSAPASRPSTTYSAPSTTTRSSGVSASQYGSRPSYSAPSTPASSYRAPSYSVPRQDAADRSQAQRQAITGQKYSSRPDVSTFRSQYGSRYQTRFTVQPAVRPAYIPTSYNNFNIVFDAGHGGYGYYSNGVWAYYDPFDDPSVAPVLMQQQGYVYRAPTTWKDVVGGLLAIIVVGGVIYFILKMLVK